MGKTYGFYWQGDWIRKKLIVEGNYELERWEFSDFCFYYTPRNMRHRCRGGRSKKHCCCSFCDKTTSNTTRKREEIREILKEINDGHDTLPFYGGRLQKRGLTEKDYALDLLDYFNFMKINY